MESSNGYWDRKAGGTFMEARLNNGKGKKNRARGIAIGSGFDPACIRREAFTYYPPLARVKRYVERHLSAQITLRMAAKIACLEEKYFSTYFHQKTGVCFSDWINYVRIGKAVKVLARRNTPISAVAENTGFGCLRTFERAFKKVTGMTPARFKKAIQTG